MRLSRGDMADILGTDDIGRAKGIGQTIEDKKFQTFGHALAKRDCLGPIGVFDRIKVLTDVCNGFSPGNPLPLARSAVSDPFLTDIGGARDG